MELKAPDRKRLSDEDRIAEIETARLRNKAIEGYLLGREIGLKQGFRRGIWAGVAVAAVAGIVCAALLAGTANAQSLTTKVTWHIMPTVEAARAKCAELMGDGKMIACARWDKGKTWCEIWAIDPTAVLNNDYHERVFGHEAVHCFKGNFHEGRPN